MAQVVEITGTSTQVLVSTPLVQEVVTPSLTTQVVTASPVVRLGGSFHIGHTFAVSGNITVVTLPAFFVSISAIQTANIIQASYKLASGTNATFKLQKNNSDMTGYGTTTTPLTATTTKATSSSTIAVGDEDQIDLVIVGVSGAPQNLSMTLTLEHTI